MPVRRPGLRRRRRPGRLRRRRQDRPGRLPARRPPSGSSARPPAAPIGSSITATRRRATPRCRATTTATGKANLAVFRPSSDQWIIRQSDGTDTRHPVRRPGHARRPRAGQLRRLGEDPVGGLPSPLDGRCGLRPDAAGPAPLTQFRPDRHVRRPGAVPGRRLPDIPGIGKDELALFRPVDQRLAHPPGRRVAPHRPPTSSPPTPRSSRSPATTRGPAGSTWPSTSPPTHLVHPEGRRHRHHRPVRRPGVRRRRRPGRLRRRRQDRPGRLPPLHRRVDHPPLLRRPRPDRPLRRPGAGRHPGAGRLPRHRQGHLAVFRPSVAVWIVRQADGTDKLIQFGDPKYGDVPAPGYYDGTGVEQIAVYRPSAGILIVLDDPNTGKTTIIPFGDPNYGDEPARSPVVLA